MPKHLPAAVSPHSAQQKTKRARMRSPPAPDDNSGGDLPDIDNPDLLDVDAEDEGGLEANQRLESDEDVDEGIEDI